MNDTNNSTKTVDFGLSDVIADVIYPFLSMEKKGNIIMVFGMPNNEIYPSGFAAVFDQDLKVKQVVPIVIGLANPFLYNSNERPRFGDYFVASTDPEDGTVWVTGEYGDKEISQFRQVSGLRL